jgi:hypothetical protein
MPPVLYSDSYEEALAHAQKMTDAEIDAQRTQLTKWYIERMNYLIKRVDTTLETTGAKQFEILWEMGR